MNLSRNIKRRIIGVTVVSLSVVLTGCVNPDGTPDNTASGALIGGAIGALAGAAAGGRGHGGQDLLIGAAIGVAAGAIAGLVMDHINAEQRARLRESSPQTLQTIQHNDQVAQQQSAPPPFRTARAARRSPHRVESGRHQGAYRRRGETRGHYQCHQGIQSVRL